MREIIKYIDTEGYLRTELEQIQKDSRDPLTVEDLQRAPSLGAVSSTRRASARNLAGVPADSARSVTPGRSNDQSGTILSLNER